MRIIKLYIITGIVFMSLDAIWLGWLAKPLYESALKDKLRTPPNWYAATAFYLIFIAGLLYFSILPSAESGKLTTALVNGSLIGLLTYSTYGLTNLSTLQGWPLKMTLIDICWGIFICTATSITSSLLASIMN
jgi:uncharacterized membrane protein